MGLYEKFVLPRLIDFSMRSKEVRRYRAQVVPAAAGRVLEVGVGSGLNLPFYSRDVQALYGLDTSPQLLTFAQKKSTHTAFPVEFVRRSAEDIPFDNKSFDTVVTTWTLCTIPDPVKALREIRRVLKLDGWLLFVEHGLSPEPRVEAWQNRLNPVWKRIGGGCNLNRKIDDLIRAAGLKITELEAGYAKGLRPVTYTYQGRARVG